MTIKRNIEDLSAAISDAMEKATDVANEWGTHLLPDIEELMGENEDLKDRVAVLEKRLAELKGDGDG